MTTEHFIDCVCQANQTAGIIATLAIPVQRTFHGLCNTIQKTLSQNGDLNQENIQKIYNVTGPSYLHGCLGCKTRLEYQRIVEGQKC